MLVNKKKILFRQISKDTCLKCGHLESSHHEPMFKDIKGSCRKGECRCMKFQQKKEKT